MSPKHWWDNLVADPLPVIPPQISDEDWQQMAEFRNPKVSFACSGLECWCHNE